MQKKAELREVALACRRKTASEARLRAGMCVADHVVKYFQKWPASIVAGYLPLGDEIDPVPTLSHLEQMGWKLTLPVVIGKGEPLLFRHWQQGDALETGAFNTCHPLPSASELIPDVLLVPLLAFDKEGQRIGWGGGFYDRTIAALRIQRSTLVLGVAFSCQRVDKVPCDNHDELLNGVITETGPYIFGS